VIGSVEQVMISEQLKNEMKNILCVDKTGAQLILIFYQIPFILK